MTIRDILKNTAPQLQPKRILCEADRSIGDLEAEVLLAHVLKKDRTWLRVHDDKMLTTAQQRTYHALVARRTKQEPIAYILGLKEFYGRSFIVNKHVLIPRPESELIVDRVREILRHKPSTTDLVWDVGTGSGAIALAIAEHISPRTVLASDISREALRVATKNAKRLNVKNVSFVHADLLDASMRTRLERKRASRLIITANLPYLPLSDKKKLSKDVVAHEPHQALFAKNNGLALIEKLIKQLASFAIPFHTVLLEYDPPQTATLRRLARSLFPTSAIRIHKDLAKRDRVLEITRVPS